MPQKSGSWITNQFPAEVQAIAQDGSDVRPLFAGEHMTIAHCQLHAQEVSRPSYNMGIDEIWVFISGDGLLWRRRHGETTKDQADVVRLGKGVTVTIPREVDFQFQSGDVALEFICITTPKWTSEDQNLLLPDGMWQPTAAREVGQVDSHEGSVDS